MSTRTDTSPSAGLTSDQPVEVFFDGSCPLCRSEISYYQKRTSDRDVRYTDVSEAFQAGRDVVPGLDAKTAMSRFHVRDETGELLSGAVAFAALWRAVPGFKTAGRVAALWGVRHILEATYRGFLIFRPSVQRIVASRAGATCADDTCQR